MRKVLFILSILPFFTCSTKQGVLRFKEGDRYGFKSLNGKIIVEPQYEFVDRSFADGYLRVVKNGKWGMVDQTGKLIITPKYDYIGYFSEDGLVISKLNGLYGCIDKTGKEIIPFVYTYIWSFEDGLAHVVKGKFNGFINTSGILVIPLEYEQFSYRWSEGLIGAYKKGKWGFINKANETIISFKYHKVGNFSEGLASASESYSKWGYINHNDSVVIPFVYEDPNYCDGIASEFKIGIAQVRLNNQSGYINRSGEIVIPIKYSCIRRFCNGYAYATVDSGKNVHSKKYQILFYGYLDTSGKEYLYQYSNFRNVDWNVGKAPNEIPDSSHLLRSWDTTQTKPWTLEKLLAHGLSAFKDEPQKYPDLCNLNQVCIACGLMIGGGNYGEDFMYPNRNAWMTFKTKTLFKIISSESLRQIVWNWIAPYYKKSFQSTNPFVQNSYKEIAVYLKNYINHYDRRKVEEYLKTNEVKFAHYDLNGNRDPNRKLGALIDRLIIIHKVITVKEAKLWINKIADEVATW
ncbi:MAG: hypothetical protein GC181_06745 [Bacteroidetes bacterium]|nr:hypothetical protein [Bacteroidota bacterium]